MDKNNEGFVNGDFLLELFKATLTSKSFAEIIFKHMKYNYIPDEASKLIFEKTHEYYTLNSELPTIGLLAQHFDKKQEVLKVLVKIKNINVFDKKDALIKAFEKYIINSKFREVLTNSAEFYNKGKQDKALKLLEIEGPKIASFSIKDTYYSKVYADFEQRQNIRKKREKDLGSHKVPFSIHELDYYTRGGMDKGTSTLILGRSGTGKTSFKRWVGASAARLGFRVVHFQCEGTEQECMDAYDACWTGISLEEMEFGIMSKEKEKIIKSTNQNILASGGEIFVKANETVEDFYINDCPDIIADIEKIHGKVDLVIFDYVEIFNIRGKQFGSSEASERKRRDDLANRITNCATSFNVCSLTSTQANDIRPEKYNNPDFFMTRSDISEFKGMLKPFSNFITLNQTDDEYDSGVIRLFTDKFRKYKSKQLISIVQSMQNSRMYDAKKTLELFWNENIQKKRED